MQHRYSLVAFAIIITYLVCSSCSDFTGPERSIVGEWGMVSGGIKDKGVFTALDATDAGFYKTLEFREDGTFTEICGECVASGTYKVTSGAISYLYSDVKGIGPDYFAIHSSGSWIYHFWEDDFFTLYDFASPKEVSMSFRRIN